MATGQARRLGGGGGGGGGGGRWVRSNPPPPPPPRSSELVPLAIKIIFYTCIARSIARENEITIHVGLATAGHPF